ncbi:MAG: NADH:ubiquinone reductase (Na(+)-transporting) subunit C [Chlamydiia bacterium]|nr:NADH:ubiquinone reductase (Na(+)-transporting) subunit C [Chlamydiia bacterium]
MPSVIIGENRVSPPDQVKRPTSSGQVLLFIIILCVIAGGLLAIIAYALADPQFEAKEFDRSRQMLIAAKILSPTGNFEILEEKAIAAIFDPQTETLVIAKAGERIPKATDDEIKRIASLRIRPLLTDARGNVFSIGEKKLNLPKYLEEHKKEGYAVQDLKLFYAILPNDSKSAKITDQDIAKDLGLADAFVVPVSGFGLWAPIYGYIALFPNGNTVIGTTWYEQAETPGLGANISEPWWQAQFFGKLIFHESSDGKTDLSTAPMGIVVVKGKVQDVLSTSPKSKSAVDGISGATLTGDGVTQAYRASLTPYREFLIKIHTLKQKKVNDNNSS